MLINKKNINKLIKNKNNAINNYVETKAFHQKKEESILEIIMDTYIDKV